MSVERDPELGRLLELGLKSPVPRAGAERRIAGRIDASRTAARRWFSHWALTCAGLIASATLLVVFARQLRHLPGQGAPAPTVSWLPLARARVALLGRATLEVERDDERETVVRLTAGTALFHVKKGTGRSFVVRAGDTRVEVVGTVFGVERAGERARVEVVEGVVRVSARGSERTLVAGQSTPAGAHLFTLAPAELERLRAPFPATTASTSPRVQPSAPEPEPTHERRAPRLCAVAEESAGPAPEPHALRSAVHPRAPTASDSTRAAVDDSYQQARALERDGAIDEATRSYTAIVSAGGAKADDAAFALARLAAERGSTAAVLSAVAAYRAGFPSGRYARDVDVLELNAHLARGDDDAARRDATRFLARCASDARAWRFHLVLATARARANDCAGAETELETVPDGPEKTNARGECPAP